MNRRAFATLAACVPALAMGVADESLEIARQCPNPRCYLLTVTSCSRHLTRAHATCNDGNLEHFRVKHGVVVDGGLMTGLIMAVDDGVTEQEIREAFAESLTNFSEAGRRNADSILAAGLRKNGFAA